MKSFWIGVALLAFGFAAVGCTGQVLNTNCPAMQQLAQEHANDMARRDHLDHAGFRSRASRGARAENVAYGHKSEAKTIAQWAASPRHAANMRLPGCKGIASAVSRSGRRYWVMEIGG